MRSALSLVLIFFTVTLSCYSDIVLADSSDCLIDQIKGLDELLAYIAAGLVSLRAVAEGLGKLARFFDNKDLNKWIKIGVAVMDSLASLIGFFGVGKPKFAKDIKSGMQETARPLKIEVSKALKTLRGNRHDT